MAYSRFAYGACQDPCRIALDPFLSRCHDTKPSSHVKSRIRTAGNAGWVVRVCRSRAERACGESVRPATLTNAAKRPAEPTPVSFFSPYRKNGSGRLADPPFRRLVRTSSNRSSGKGHLSKTPGPADHAARPNPALSSAQSAQDGHQTSSPLHATGPPPSLGATQMAANPKCGAGCTHRHQAVFRQRVEAPALSLLECAPVRTDRTKQPLQTVAGLLARAALRFSVKHPNPATHSRRRGNRHHNQLVPLVIIEIGALQAHNLPVHSQRRRVLEEFPL